MSRRYMVTLPDPDKKKTREWAEKHAWQKVHDSVLNKPHSNSLVGENYVPTSANLLEILGPGENSVTCGCMSDDCWRVVFDTDGCKKINFREFL